MNKQLVFIGAGGHAQVIYDIVMTNAKYFIDDQKTSFFDLEKLHECDLLTMNNEVDLVMGIGGVTPAQLTRRFNMYELFKDKKFTFPAIFHIRAIISSLAMISSGSMVFAGAIVNAGAQVGEGVIINTGAIIEHDVVVADGAHICPGAIVLGGAQIGKNALIGAGAVVLPGAIVEEGALIKALTRYPG